MNSRVNKVRIIKITCNILKDLIVNKWKDLFSEMRIEISLSSLLIPIVFFLCARLEATWLTLHKFNYLFLTVTLWVDIGIIQQSQVYTGVHPRLNTWVWELQTLERTAAPLLLWKFHVVVEMSSNQIHLGFELVLSEFKEDNNI